MYFVYYRLQNHHCKPIKLKNFTHLWNIKIGPRWRCRRFTYSFSWENGNAGNHTYSLSMYMWALARKRAMCVEIDDEEEWKFSVRSENGTLGSYRHTNTQRHTTAKRKLSTKMRNRRIPKMEKYYIVEIRVLYLYIIFLLLLFLRFFTSFVCTHFIASVTQPCSRMPIFQLSLLKHPLLCFFSYFYFCFIYMKFYV